MSFTIYKGVNPLNIPKSMRFNAVVNLQQDIESFFGSTCSVYDYYYYNGYHIIIKDGLVYHSSDRTNWAQVSNISFGSSSRFIDENHIAYFNNSNRSLSLYQFRTDTLVSYSGDTNVSPYYFAVDYQTKTYVAMGYVSGSTTFPVAVYAASLSFTDGSYIKRLDGDSVGTFSKGSMQSLAITNGVLAVGAGGKLFIKNIFTNNIVAPEVKTGYYYYMDVDTSGNVYCSVDAQSISMLPAGDYANNTWQQSVSIPAPGDYGVGAISVIKGIIYTAEHTTWNDPQNADGFIRRATDVTATEWPIIDNMVESPVELYGTGVKSFDYITNELFLIKTNNYQVMLYYLR